MHFSPECPAQGLALAEGQVQVRTIIWGGGGGLTVRLTRWGAGTGTGVQLLLPAAPRHVN